jgi:hypothetical protein
MTPTNWAVSRNALGEFLQLKIILGRKPSNKGN